MQEYWKKTEQQLIQALPNKKLWLEGASYENYENGVLTISFDSEFRAKMFTNQLKTEAENTLAVICGEKSVRIKAVVAQKTAQKAKKTEPAGKEAFPKAAGSQTLRNSDSEQKEAVPERANATLNPKYTFDNFIVGESCRFAYNVAKVIGDNPGTSLNPCLIYGGVGLGKTHLIQAIGNYITERSRLNVIYVTSENFTNELIKCFVNEKSDATSKFKNKYRNADVLLIDDIHFIANKEGIQEEFFNTFNDLTEKNHQIVLTCDRPLSELTGVNERLITRFRKGVNVDLVPPSYEERMAIAKQKCIGLKYDIREDVLEFVCQNIKSNVRDLEGALTTLASFSNLVGQEVTVDIAREHIRNFLPSQMIKNSEITIDSIIHETAKYFGVSSYDVSGRGRSKTLVTCRHISMYLSSTLTNLTLSEIGKFFAGKDHTTVSYAIKKITTSLECGDESIVESVKAITEALKNN